MKEHPILFSAPMVRAILDGTKTETRRAIRPDSSWTRFCPGDKAAAFRTFHVNVEHGDIWHVGDHWQCGDERLPQNWQTGDRLWVKETFARVPMTKFDMWAYRATAGSVIAENVPRWTPSIFMPRSASRILLDVVGVRVERLRDISLESINAEGTPHSLDPRLRPVGSRYDQWRNLWESINGPESWALNPLVWVLTFRRVES